MLPLRDARVAVFIRAMAEADVPAILAACLDWEELSAHGPPHWRPRSSAELQRKVATVSGPAVASEYNFVIVRDDALVGECSVHAIDWRSRVAQVGVCIWDPTDRGQGVGHDATSQLIHWASEHLDLIRLEAWILVDNDASIGLFRALGFEPEGTLRSRYVQAGLRRDVHVLGRVRSSVATGAAKIR